MDKTKSKTKSISKKNVNKKSVSKKNVNKNAFKKLDSKIKVMEINTVAKVGSSDFWESAKLTGKYKIHHGHSLERLRYTFTNWKNTVTIVGIRNPLDRNISYFFECYKGEYHNDVKVRSNEYKGEMMYFCKPEEICKYEARELISVFFKRNFHKVYNEWFEEFFEITGLDKMGFDKEKGYQIYKFPGNNYILMYTLEKLNQNAKEICDFLGFKELVHANDSSEKIYKEKYNEVKKEITFSEEYKKEFLHTRIMDFFYTKDEIKQFFDKYPTSKKNIYKSLKNCVKKNNK